jgi:hypothetical protein
MLSSMLHMHPEVLSLSEFWNLFLEREGNIPTHDMSGEQFWRKISDPAPSAYDGLVAAGIITNDVQFPYHGRFDHVNGFPSVMHVLIRISDDPDLLYDKLAPEVSAWPRRPVAEHCRALFADLAGRLGRPAMVERTGGSLWHLPLLRQQFPEARFVFLYRNGPDTVLSMSRYPTYRLGVLNAIAEAACGSSPEFQSLLDALPAEIRTASPDEFKGIISPPFDKERFLAFPIPPTYYGWLWSDQIRTGTREIRQVRRDRWATLRYEHLLKDTRAALTGLADFIGVPAEPQWLDRACQFVDPGRPRRAAAAFHPSDLAELRSVCAAGTRAFELLESEHAASAEPAAVR